MPYEAEISRRNPTAFFFVIDQSYSMSEAVGGAQNSKSVMLAQDTTDANGNYTVIAPTPGSYRIRVVLPGSDWSFSPIDQGGNDTEDSDISSSVTNLGFTNSISIARNARGM